jgi:Mg-chelatase subunit ChlI
MSCLPVFYGNLDPVGILTEENSENLTADAVARATMALDAWRGMTDFANGDSRRRTEVEDSHREVRNGVV